MGTRVLALSLLEGVACFAFWAIEALLIFYTIRQIKEAVVAIEMHSFWALEAESLLELETALVGYDSNYNWEY